MKKHLQRILSLLCVLAMAIGTVSALADPAAQEEARIISVVWDDENNYDGIRPTDLNASLADVPAKLTEKGGWTGQVSVPAERADEDWVIQAPDGYSCISTSRNGIITKVKFHHKANAGTTEATAKITWDDSDDKGKIRPKKVKLTLLADGETCGEPKNASASDGWSVTWKDLPEYKPNSSTKITYSVQEEVPAGYEAVCSGMNVTNTVLTGNLVLSANITNAPNESGLGSLHLTVNGPDPSMPVTVEYSRFNKNAHTYAFKEPVLAGTYYIFSDNADQLFDDYYIDPSSSQMVGIVTVEKDSSAILRFKANYKKLSEAGGETNDDPLADKGSLVFDIYGPDPRMPYHVSYSEFTNGKYELDNLVPGVYVIVERNAETLVRAYTLRCDSKPGAKIVIEPGKTASAELYNHYSPVITPVPEGEKVSIPVVKTWEDKRNADGNRPSSITVWLYADGVEVDSHKLTAKEGWKYTFTDKPAYKYTGGKKTAIVYTVNEDDVDMYTKSIDGWNIKNTYTPETTSVTVRKAWQDDEDAAGLRPDSIIVRLLANGKRYKTVVLTRTNGWTYTADNLPVKINGEKVVYTWKEYSVLGYTQGTQTTSGSVTVITNRIRKTPDEKPPRGKKPKKPGPPTEIEPYEPALGLEITINHVGDCFD